MYSISKELNKVTSSEKTINAKLNKIMDEDDNETITKVAMDLGARGTLQTLTIPAIPPDR